MFASVCRPSQCPAIVKSGCAVTPVVLVDCGAHLKSPSGPPPTPWFTVLLLSHADKYFTPHQRRLLPAEWHLSALSSHLSIFPSLSVFAFLSSSCVHPHVEVTCISSLVQTPRIFLHCVKNKRPSFYASCISLLCPFFLLFNLFIFKWLKKTSSLDFKFLSSFSFCISTRQ